jgi:hypothetical protein
MKIWSGLALAAALALAAPARGADTAGARPVIHKLGTVGLDIVETTPFVFQGKAYRMEWFRAGGCLRIMDRASHRELSRFGARHQFACAYATGDQVCVVGTQVPAGKWNGGRLTMFTSKDLTNWTERVIYDHGAVGICNTSLCQAGDRYVMSIELTEPGGFPARFIESKDLVTWTLMPKECQHALGRYNAPHCLRWNEGWFYLFYLEADKPRGYEQYVTRSRDLIHWEPSPLNPVLAASPEDKLPANANLTAAEREKIARAADVNNSDIDFCDSPGGLIINYSWGNQQGVEFLGEATYAGTTAQFLKAWFPTP